MQFSIQEPDKFFIPKIGFKVGVTSYAVGYPGQWNRNFASELLGEVKATVRSKVTIFE